MLAPAPIVALGTFDPRDPGGIHDLVRRFREGDREVFTLAAAAASEAARLALGDEPGRMAIVPVPDHVVGVHRGPRIELARVLATSLGAIAPYPPPLRRLVDGGSARAAGPRDPAPDAAALAWDDAAVEPGTTILLLDDVLASGGTLAAAAAAIGRDSRVRRSVRALVLAVARLDAGTEAETRGPAETADRRGPGTP